MGIIDSLRKSKLEATKDPSIPPPKGHTVDEIMRDPKMSHLFGKHLEKEGQHELAQRLVDGTLTAEDIDALQEQRSLFSEKILQTEKITKLLTKEAVIEIAQGHESFGKIISIYGPEKVMKMVQDHLLEVAFTDEDKFKPIAESITTFDSFKNGQYKKVGADAEKFCNEKKISTQEYLNAIAITDEDEKQKALKKLVTRRYGKVAKFFNAFGGKVSEGDVENLKLHETYLNNSIGELNDHQKNIGEVLSLSITNDDFMRNTLSRELVAGKKAVAEPKPGFGDGKRETPVFNEGQFDKDWEAFKVKMAYDSSTDEEKGYVQAQFIDEQKNAYRAKVKSKGFWASVLAAMFEKKISNKIDTLE